MIGVNPPGHFLWYGKDTSELDAAVRALLRAGRELQRADG